MNKNLKIWFKQESMRDILYNFLVQGGRVLSLKGIHTMGDLLGEALWLSLLSRRKYTIKAIESHLDDVPDSRILARKSFHSSGRSFAEMLYSRIDFRFLEEKVEFENPDIVEQIKNTSRPVVATTAHFGAWEILGKLTVILTEKPGMIVVRLPKDRSLGRVIVHQRSGARVRIQEHRNAVSKVFRHLHKGGIVGFLADHNCLRHEALFLPFLGKTAAVNSGPALLAVRSKALLWPAFLLRLPHERFKLISYPPLDTCKLEGSRTEKMEQCATYYTRAIEDIVHRYPEQWFWMHKRWKTRPEVEESNTG